MKYQEHRSELLKNAFSGSLKNTVGAKTYTEIQEDLRFRDGPLLEKLLRDEVATNDYLNAYGNLQKKAEQNAIIFDFYEQFEEFCYALYNPNWAKQTIEHERKHALDIEQHGLSVRYGLIIFNKVYDMPFVLDNLPNIAVSWSKEKLIQYLKETSEIDGLGLISDTDYSIYRLTRKYTEGLLTKISRIISLRPI